MVIRFERQWIKNRKGAALLFDFICLCCCCCWCWCCICHYFKHLLGSLFSFLDNAALTKFIDCDHLLHTIIRYIHRIFTRQKFLHVCVLYDVHYQNNFYYFIVYSECTMCRHIYQRSISRPIILICIEKRKASWAGAGAAVCVAATHDGRQHCLFVEFCVVLFFSLATVWFCIEKKRTQVLSFSLYLFCYPTRFCHLYSMREVKAHNGKYRTTLKSSK